MNGLDSQLAVADFGSPRSGRSSAFEDQTEDLLPVVISDVSDDGEDRNRHEVSHEVGGTCGNEQVGISMTNGSRLSRIESD